MADTAETIDLPSVTESLRLDNQLCYALYAAAHRMTKSYRPLLERLGLTYPQYLVLLTLWEQDGLPVHAIGERLGLDSGTLTPLLKRMAESELVTRVRDKLDERMVRIHLTTRGKRLEAKAAAFPQQIGAAASCSAVARAE